MVLTVWRRGKLLALLGITSHFLSHADDASHCAKYTHHTLSCWSTDYRMSSQSVNGPTICIYEHTYECTHTQNIQRWISEKASRNSPLNNYTSLTQSSLTCVALNHDLGLLSILCKQNRSIHNIFGIYKYSYKICLYHWFQFSLLYFRLLK